jgi:protease II
LIHIPGYYILEEIGESLKTLVYRVEEEAGHSGKSNRYIWPPP